MCSSEESFKQVESQIEPILFVAGRGYLLKAVSEKVTPANRIRKYTVGLNICGDAAHAPALTNRVPHGYELSQSGIKQLSSLKPEKKCRLRTQKIYSLKPIAELEKEKRSLPSHT